jgi:hypothetical protein
MQPADRTEFLAILNGLAAIKPGVKLTPEALTLWWSCMRGWSIADFRAAASHLATSMEFMPSPFHFEQLRKAARLPAGEAWDQARRACGTAVQGGHVTQNGSCGDELIDRAVRALGGYGVIAMCESDKLHFLERRFAEHYDAIQDADDTREAVPQIARSATGRISGPQSAAALLAKDSR